MYVCKYMNVYVCVCSVRGFLFDEVRFICSCEYGVWGIEFRFFLRVEIILKYLFIL